MEPYFASGKKVCQLIDTEVIAELVIAAALSTIA